MKHPLNATRTLGLAPMEGLIDASMRQILTQVGHFDYCVTEFLRVVDQRLPERVFYRVCPELHQGGLTASGVPVHIQLLGSHPQAMAENAALAAHLGAPVIDINFGCPAKTVNRNMGGAALLAYPERIYQTVLAIRKAVPKTLPVSAKMRLGLEQGDQALDIALAIEAAGANWITVHARTKAQGYRPPVYWEQIAPIQARLSCPIVANGDITCLETATACESISQCSHLMIGRGAVRNPRLSAHLKTSSENATWDWPQTRQVLLQYHQITTPRVSHPAFLLGRLKQWLAFFKETVPDAKVFFEKHKRTGSLQAFMIALATFKADE